MSRISVPAAFLALGLIVVLGILLVSHSWTYALNSLVWLFGLYTAYAVGFAYLSLPKAEPTEQEERTSRLTDAVKRVAGGTSREVVASTYLKERVEALRCEIESGYAEVRIHTEAFGLYGPIAAVLGLLSLMPQVYSLSQVVIASADANTSTSAALAAVFAQVSVWTLGVTFFTILLSLLGRTFLGSLVDLRLNQEIAGLSGLETTLRDQLPSHLKKLESGSAPQEGDLREVIREVVSADVRETVRDVLGAVSYKGEYMDGGVVLKPVLASQPGVA